MINIQKIGHFVATVLVFTAFLAPQTTNAQVIELTTPQGSMKFQLIENQKYITDYIIKQVESAVPDSVTLTGAVPGYMVSVWPPLAPVRVQDTVPVGPTGPHYRGVLTAPIDIDLQGNRTVRLDRMMIVHGKTYTPADVKTLYASYNNTLKKDLFIRLYDTVIKYRFTPLADTLKDRYGRADRKKIKRNTEPLMDSLSRVYAAPDMTGAEIAEYEMRGGLPAMDGKYLIIGTLKEGEDVLNRIMNEQVNKSPRAQWSRVKE